MSQGNEIQNDIPFFLFRGTAEPDVVVVCDPLVPDPTGKGPLPYPIFELLLRVLRESDVDYSKFLFVPGSQPGPKFNDFKTETQRKDAFAEYAEGLRKYIASVKPRLVIALGPLATLAATGKKYSMKEYRGHVLENVEITPEFKTSFFLTQGIELVHSHPKHYPVMKNDFCFLKQYIQSDYNLTFFQKSIEHPFDLQWATDIQFLLDMDLRYIAVDAETQGLHWYRSENALLTVQIAFSDTQAVVIPVNREYWPDMSLEQLKKLRGQIKQLLSNPKIQKTGHNLVFDYMWFKREGFDPKGFRFDSQQLAHAVNENTPLNLRDCIKIYEPALAGYSDIFDRTVNKANMMAVPYDQMLVYGGGDAVASYRLTKTLVNILRKDEALWNCVNRLKLPCLFGLADSIATNGIKIDPDRLRKIAAKFSQEYDDLEERLLKEVPKSIKQRALVKGTTDDPLSLTRDEILRNYLFTEEGLNLKPTKFTASGDPSTSIKEHLPYFDVPFVDDYIDLSKLGKFLSTYIGDELAKTGFWQYFADDSKIYPSYSLSMTDTGRTSSRDPNGQNIPQHGTMAKEYKTIFIPDGIKSPEPLHFFEADYSQAELRIMAIESNDPVMMDIYSQGLDMHKSTAALVMGVSLEEYLKLPKAIAKPARQQAKAVNFGLIYEMWYKKLPHYAKTTYKLEMTEEQAKLFNDKFFNLYAGIKPRNTRRKEEAKRNGFVRYLHGYCRHLPDIYSPDNRIRREAERQAVNSPIQGFASDLGVLALNLMHRDMKRSGIDWMTLKMYVHDSIKGVTTEKRAREACAILRYYMENLPIERMFGITLPIPLLSDVGHGPNMADIVELEGEAAVEPYRPSWCTL